MVTLQDSDFERLAFTAALLKSYKATELFDCLIICGTDGARCTQD